LETSLEIILLNPFPRISASYPFELLANKAGVKKILILRNFEISFQKSKIAPHFWG